MSSYGKWTLSSLILPFCALLNAPLPAQEIDLGLIRGITAAIVESINRSATGEVRQRDLSASMGAAEDYLCVQRFGLLEKGAPKLIVKESENETLAEATAALTACQLGSTRYGVPVRGSDAALIGHVTTILADAESQRPKYWVVFKLREWVAYDFADARPGVSGDAVVVREGAPEFPLIDVLPEYKLSHDGLVGPAFRHAARSAGLAISNLDSTLVASVGGWGLVPSDKVEISISSIPDGAIIQVGEVSHGTTSISGWIQNSALDTIVITSSGYLPCSMASGAKVEQTGSRVRFICELVPSTVD